MLEKILSVVLMLIFTAVYGYQFYYLILSLLHKPITFRSERQHKYAVVIAARNEEKVIGDLLDALDAQDYPKGLLDVYVCADNCTDGTAALARSRGARVYERENINEIGKGHALTYTFEHIDDEVGIRFYDGYFIFDADNIPAKDFVSRINDAFDAGYEIVSGYRAPLNFDDSWVSACSSLYFLREARFLSTARMILGTGSTVSGTGYVISSAVLERFGGWRWHLLCEDLEFSAECACEGIRIGYCDEAVFCDEQPLTLAQSLRQRLRWIKGGLQVFSKYLPRLLARLVKTGDFTCFDILASLSPVLMLTPVSIILSPVNALIAFAAPMLLYAALLFITERRRLRCPRYKKLPYIIMFPVFMMAALPVSYVALFRRVTWKPIAHGAGRLPIKTRKKAL